MSATQPFQDHLPDQEQRAFVYQKIQELHDFAPQAGHMLVILQKTPAGKGPERFAATLRFAGGPAGVEWRQEGDDFYATVASMKEQAKEFLDKYFSSADEDLEEGEEELTITDWPKKH